MGVKTRDILEVHSVDPRDERQRHEDGRERGEYAHNIVRAARQAGLVSFPQVAHQIPERIECFRNFDGIFVDVAKIFF